MKIEFDLLSMPWYWGLLLLYGIVSYTLGNILIRKATRECSDLIDWSTPGPILLIFLWLASPILVPVYFLHASLTWGIK